MSALYRAIPLIILAVSVAAGQSSGLAIEHKDPQLSYSGVVIYTGEDARQFGFSGAIDGKAYPMDRSFGSGTVTMRRIDPLTVDRIQDCGREFH